MSRPLSLVLCVLALLLSASLRADEKIKSVSAKEWNSDYKENPVAADKKYKGKTFVVYGSLSGIHTSGSNGIVVVDLSAAFLFEDASVLEKLKRGQRVEIEGLCTGKLGFTECKLVE